MDGAPGQIGVYTIVREIAQGGTGVVYLAARTADFHKQVAVKVLKRGMDTAALLERFERERQILARLDHPHIARLLDGGALPDGRPYLVMEYVDGEPITAHAARLAVAERLRLFLQVCDGVSCAHRSLVVHRDLKPGNILVTAEGAVKLLDFGIAKLLEAGAGQTMEMQPGERGPFTPEYASPEQIQGRPVTVASDIYSLGAVLYEMLSGRPAHVLNGRSAGEIERAVCEREVARPAGFGVHLAADLEAILAMALRKEPDRRYRSVEQLAADVRSYLAGRPVLAHPDSAAYRAGKFLRRHKGMMLAAGLAIAGVLAGTAMAVYETRLARRNALVAEQRFAQVRKLAGTMLFEQYDRIRSLPGATKARESIVQTAQQYLDSLAAEAGNDRALALELVAAYHRLGDVQGMPGGANLGRVPDAIRSYSKAQALLQELPLTDAQVLKLSILNLRIAALHEREGRMDVGRRLRHQRLQLAQRLYAMGREQNDAWYGLIYALQSAAVADADAGFAREALPNLQEALRLAEEWDRRQSTVRTQSVLGQVYSDLARLMRGLGDPGQAVAYGEKVLAIRQKTVRSRPNHEPYWRQAFSVHWFLGMDLAHPILLSLGDVRRAAHHCGEALRWARKTSDADPANEQAKIDLALAHRCVGTVHLMASPGLGVAEFRRSLAITQPILEAKPTVLRHLDDVANSWWGLASALRRSGRLADAGQPYQIALRLFDQILEKSRELSYRQQWIYARMEYGLMRKNGADLEKALAMALQAAKDFPGPQTALDAKRATEARKKVGE